jgi:hypothetical protein
MNDRTATLKQLIADSSYPMDEAAVAQAILVRSLARRVVPEIAFRAESHLPRVRSFRPHRDARSFRLARAERRMAERVMNPAGQFAHAA